MLSKNLVKYVSVAQEETRIIDSNELLRRRREALGIVEPSGEEGHPGDSDEIGRATCRERVCMFV